MRRATRAIAVLTCCVLGASLLLLAAIIGDLRRCHALPHGTPTWQTYCGEQR